MTEGMTSHDSCMTLAILQKHLWHGERSPRETNLEEEESFLAQNDGRRSLASTHSGDTRRKETFCPSKNGCMGKGGKIQIEFAR